MVRFDSYRMTVGVNEEHKGFAAQRKSSPTDPESGQRKRIQRPKSPCSQNRIGERWFGWSDLVELSRSAAKRELERDSRLSRVRLTAWGKSIGWAVHEKLQVLHHSS